MPSTIEQGMRVCNRCHESLPATDVHFYRRVSGTQAGQLMLTCRGCRRRAAAGRTSSRRTTSPRSRRFGFEMEFIGSKSAVARALQLEGIDARATGYTHRVTRTWKIVPDGSVMGGGELVSPPLRMEQALELMPKVQRAMAAAGASVNHSTGLHVHHEVTDLDVRAFGRMFRFWYNCQDALNTLVSPSRNSNAFCRPLDRLIVEQCETLSALNRETTRRAFGNINRYMTLNVCSFPRYGTIEVRQHQGTLNAEKIINWTKLAQAMLTFAKGTESMIRESSSLTNMLDTLVEHGGLDAEVASYWHSRVAELADNARQGTEVFA